MEKLFNIFISDFSKSFENIHLVFLLGTFHNNFSGTLENISCQHLKLFLATVLKFLKIVKIIFVFLNSISSKQLVQNSHLFNWFWIQIINKLLFNLIRFHFLQLFFFNDKLLLKSFHLGVKFVNLGLHLIIFDIKFFNNTFILFNLLLVKRYLFLLVFLLFLNVLF